MKIEREAHPAPTTQDASRRRARKRQAPAWEAGAERFPCVLPCSSCVFLPVPDARPHSTQRLPGPWADGLDLSAVSGSRAQLRVEGISGGPRTMWNTGRSSQAGPQDVRRGGGQCWPRTSDASQQSLAELVCPSSALVLILGPQARHVNGPLQSQRRAWHGVL